MEKKTFEFEIKELSEEGKFSGYLSTFGNVDAGGDIVDAGAFKKTLRDNKAFPLIWAHQGTPEAVAGSFTGKEDEKGLLIDGGFFLDLDGGLKSYKTAKKLKDEGIKLGLSMGYKTVKYLMDQIDGIQVRRLKEVKLKEGSITLWPMNDQATLETIKEEGEIAKAEWTVAYINDLPNSAFAVIEPAYSSGDTEDKRARHLPHHGKDGEVDLPHLRNALARMNQITPVTNSISAAVLRSKASAHLLAHAKKLNVGKEAEAEGEEFYYEQKPYPNEHSCRLKDPGGFERFARMKRKHDGKEYSVIIGFKKGGGSEDQAYRYPKDTWPAEEARKHCKDHDGSFEAATGKELTIVCKSCGESQTLTLTEPADATQPGAEPSKAEPVRDHSENESLLSPVIEGLEAGMAKPQHLLKQAIDTLEKS
jgi:hypothetical protein